MYSVNYHRASSVADAAKLAKKGDAKFLSGGMTLIPAMKTRLASPSDLVDLAHIGALKGIKVSGKTVTIGAATTHAEVAADEKLNKAVPAVGYLAGHIGDPHVRNSGTIGGSIANNDPAADYPSALLALGATIVTNKREIAADKFFTGLFETALKDGEIVTAVSFSAARQGRLRKVSQPGVALCDHRRVRCQEQGWRARRRDRGRRKRRLPGQGDRGSARQEIRAGRARRHQGFRQEPDGRHPRLAGVPRQSDRGDGQARGRPG